MRFLVVSKSKHPMPPEIGVGLVEAMRPWVDRHPGKFEQVWSFAGVPGGGGILNVESLEELDAIMTEFPFGPFSETEVLPLVDLDQSLDRVKQAMAMVVDDD